MKLQPLLMVQNAEGVDGNELVYRFAVDTSERFTSEDLQQSEPVPEGDAETSWTPETLRDNTWHYWKAWAHDGHGAGEEAFAGLFVNTANDLPTVPEVVSPAAGDLVGAEGIELVLTNATDVDRDALAYEFQVARDEGFEDLVVSAQGEGAVPEGQEQTAFAVPTALEPGNYRWRARAIDEHGGQGPWCEPAAFKVTNRPPPAPKLVSPEDGEAIAAGAEVTLVVSKVSDPDGGPVTYDFEVHRDEQLSDLAAGMGGILQGDGGQTAWKVEPELEPGEYRWRARAVDRDGGESPWSAARRFTLGSKPPPQSISEEEGCACTAAGPGTGLAPWLILLLLGLALRRALRHPC